MRFVKNFDKVLAVNSQFRRFLLVLGGLAQSFAKLFDWHIKYIFPEMLLHITRGNWNGRFQQQQRLIARTKSANNE